MATTETSKETVLVDGEERPYDDLTFVSIVGPGLVVQHEGWAERELEGPGGLEPDPMTFGSTQKYVPRNAVEAKELLEHPHRQGNTGQSNLFCLEPQAADTAPEAAAAEEIPDGYAKVDGEIIPVEDLLGDSNGHANGQSDASSEAETETPASSSDADPSGLDPLTAEDGTITRKQEAVEALAAAGVDFSDDEAPSPHDPKESIVQYAHEQGYFFPNYED